MRPAATEGVLYPTPRLVAFHRSGGPLAGQLLSNPVSRQRSVRSRPCHCGQSDAQKPMAKKTRLKALLALRIFIAHLQSHSGRARHLSLDGISPPNFTGRIYSATNNAEHRE